MKKIKNFFNSAFVLYAGIALSVIFAGGAMFYAYTQKSKAFPENSVTTEQVKADSAANAAKNKRTIDSMKFAIAENQH